MIFILDKYIIKYASPTLGKIKTGSLFKVYKNNQLNLEEIINKYNTLLNDLDLYLDIIYSCKKYDLIYIYNLKMLENDMNNQDVKDFLKIYNYENESVVDYINNLKKRFSLLKKTPHEIGVFLGYPLDDVKCFIEYKGKNFKLSGCWKVYNNVENSHKKFQNFKKYRDQFTYLYENNHSLKSLINKKL